MADLENLLLQAAGRTGGTSGRKNNSRPHTRWRKEGSYSDGSDSNDGGNPDNKFTKRKQSQIPLKKRFDPPDQDGRKNWGDGDGEGDDRLSGDDSDSAPSVGSDLYKGDEDKDELGKMSELDREMILLERSERVDDYKLKQHLRASSSKMDKKARQETPPPLSSRGRSSVRSADKMAAKSDALNELRAKRMKQQDPEAYHKLKDSTVRTSSISTAAKVSPPAKPKTTSGRGSSLSDSGDSEGGGKSDGEEEFPGESKMGDNLEDDMSPGRLDPLKFEDIKDITIRRSKLAKWCMEPFFEDVIVGCFVRIGIGKTRSGIPRYRLCTVRNVDATDPDRQYKLENWTTCKWLNCVWGNETSAARWQMIMVSDSPPLEEEFKEWVQEVERTGGRMPTAQEVQDKKKAIHKTNTFEYTAATVKQMLQEKKSASSRRINIAAEKDKLRKEMEVAQSRRDEAEIERIRSRLKELENMSQQSKQNAKAVRLAEMNRKNRAENFKNASGLKPVNTSLKAGEAGYDPFSRRWTRSRNYYISKPEGTGDEPAAATADNVTAVVGSTEKIKAESSNGMEAGVVATAAALEAAAGAGKLVDTSAPVDQGTESNSLHNFELPISLAGLQKFGGAQGVQLGFLARKQRIEATVGYMIPDNDSRRHPLTLTVSDYKRRRGLL